MIRFRCPTCAKTLKVSADAAGKPVTCPRCMELSVAPATPSEPEVKCRVETPASETIQSPRGRWAAILLATLSAIGLLTAVLCPILGGAAWITHGAIFLTGASVIALLVVLHGRRSGCPDCGKWWSRTKVRSEVGERELFDRGNATFGRSTTRTEYKCEDCGHSWSITEAEEYQVPERPPTPSGRRGKGSGVN